MARAKKKPNELDPALVDKIKEDIARWRPGLWAAEVAYGPTCKCGMPEKVLISNPKFATMKCEPIFICPAHERDARLGHQV